MLEMIVETFLPMLLSIVGLAIGTLISIILARLVKKYGEDELWSEALEALRVGVDHAQVNFVEWAKRASEDGKLHKDEVREALDMAWATAIDIAKTPEVKKLIQSWTKEQLESFVQRILDRKQD